MTLSKFIKQLQKLEASGHGRWKVAVDKPSLWDGNETFEICAVGSVTAELLNVSDGDGGFSFNKDGSERMVRTIILKGGQ